MKITDIDWTIGKRYVDKEGKIWEVDHYSGSLENAYHETIEETTLMRNIVKMEFEEVAEKRYYLRFKKPYISSEANYLGVEIESGQLTLGNNNFLSGYKTEFTVKEIHEFVVNNKLDVGDFDRVVAEG